MNQEIYVIVFESTHYAISAERLFKESGYKFDIIPTPREITHSCGLSIKFNMDDLKSIMKEVEENDIAVKGVYKIEKIHNQKNVMQIS